MTLSQRTLRTGMVLVIICMLCIPSVLAEPSGRMVTSAGMALPEISTLDAAPLHSPDGNITRITYYIRKRNGAILGGQINPVTGGSITIDCRDIVYFNISAQWTGPTGSSGFLDLYDQSGSYPLKGVERVDVAMLVPKGKTGILTTPPYWFNGPANNGTYSYLVELWGNSSSLPADMTSFSLKVTGLS